jgi:hypothetical protein
MLQDGQEDNVDQGLREGEENNVDQLLRASNSFVNQTLQALRDERAENRRLRQELQQRVSILK